jgi:RNA polymerase sigma-32 factor
VGFRGYGLPMSDLISEGSVGMVRALRGFDPERGLRLATYAKWWIRAAIQEYILHARSLVKMGTTTAQRKLFFNLSRLKGEMNAIDDGDLHADQVAKIVTVLGVPEHDVISMNRRLAAPDHSLNVPTHRDDDDEWQDRLVDDASDQETVFAEREELAVRKMLLGETFNVLNKREQHVVTERWLKEDTTPLDVLAAQYGTSREQVRQTELRALAKLRKAVKARMVVRVVRSATMEMSGASA